MIEPTSPCQESVGRTFAVCVAILQRWPACQTRTLETPELPNGRFSVSAMLLDLSLGNFKAHRDREGEDGRSSCRSCFFVSLMLMGGSREG